MASIPEITAKIRAFRDARDWAQFHNPKDMAIAISLESAELLEHFLWKNPEEVASRVTSHLDEITDEIADIAIYLTELADNLGIDLVQAMDAKLAKNEAKYPAEKVSGSSKKYTEYPEA